MKYENRDGDEKKRRKFSPESDIFSRSSIIYGKVGCLIDGATFFFLREHSEYFNPLGKFKMFQSARGIFL